MYHDIQLMKDAMKEVQDGLLGISKAANEFSVPRADLGMPNSSVAPIQMRMGSVFALIYCS